MSIHSGRSILFTLLFTLVAPLSAQDDWSVKWSNGFKVESDDQKFKLKFGGRIQADYTFVDADPGLDVDGDGFEFRRARLFFSGTIYERVEFKAQYEFTGGSSNFQDVWIGLNQDWGQVRFGHYKEYFSLEELTSDKYLAFLERSLPVGAFAPGHNSGLGAHGKRGDKLNWGIGYFYDADGFGVSTDEDNTNLTGRVGFRPVYEDKGRRLLHIGLGVTRKDRASSLRFRNRPEAHFSGRFVDTRSFAADGALVTTLEIGGVMDRLWFAGEYLQADVDAPPAGDPTFDGHYAQAGYFLTDDYRRFKTKVGAFDRQKPSSNWLRDGGRGAWEVAARLSSVDLNDGTIAGGEQDNLTLGLNWYPNPATRLMINWVSSDVEGTGDADFFLVRWQVDF